MTKKSPPMTNIYGIKTKTMLLLYKYRIKPVIKQRLFSNLALIGVKNKRRKQMIKTIMKRCAVLMLCMVMTVGLFGTLICRPISCSSWQNSRTCTSGASCFSTMIIVFCLLCLFKKSKRRGRPAPLPQLVSSNFSFLKR